MPPEYLMPLNAVMALLFAGGLFALQLLCIPGLRVIWNMLSEANKDQVSDVIKFLFGPETAP